MESDCLGRLSYLLSPSSPGPGSDSSTVTLILDRHVQHLPWESLPVLKEHIVCRMPSLPFMAAHRIMVSMILCLLGLRNCSISFVCWSFQYCTWACDIEKLGMRMGLGTSITTNFENPSIIMTLCIFLHCRLTLEAVEMIWKPSLSILTLPITS